MGVEKRKRGRPAGSISRNRQYRVTLSDDEFDHIEHLSKLTNKSKADIFREAFKFYENYELVRRMDDDTNEDDGGEFYDEYDDFDEDFD